MKDKVLLKVKLPATQRSYEFRLPFDLTVDEGAGLVSSILATRESTYFEDCGGADFMLLTSGDELNPNETFRALVEQGVLVDGSSVALV
ncbi:MAG: hypothetical protein ACOYIK_02235 [Coriobacteriales bacterium]|jgi:hypothetical protein